MPTNPHDQEVITPRLFARLPVVLSVAGLGRSTVYRMAADGSFPSPIRLGRRAVALRWTDLDEWSRQRPPGAR